MSLGEESQDFSEKMSKSIFFSNFDRTVLRRQKELDAQKKTGDASGLKRSFLGLLIYLEGTASGLVT